MLVEVLIAKLQEVKVTHSSPDYEGSISLCPRIIAELELKPYDVVWINNFNGHRDKTYVLEGKKGQVAINGALSCRHKVGDRISINVYAYLEKDSEEDVFGKPNIA